MRQASVRWLEKCLGKIVPGDRHSELSVALQKSFMEASPTFGTLTNSGKKVRVAVPKVDTRGLGVTNRLIKMGGAQGLDPGPSACEGASHLQGFLRLMPFPMFPNNLRNLLSATRITPIPSIRRVLATVLTQRLVFRVTWSLEQPLAVSRNRDPLKG